MILDAEGAVIEYMTEHMVDIVGHGNDTVPVYRYNFSSEAKDTVISVFLELPGNDKYIPELMPVGLRIITRSGRVETAFILIQNVDSLIDKLVRKELNTSVECCLCSRNSGPNRFLGTNGLAHYTTLYEMTLRAL